MYQTNPIPWHPIPTYSNNLLVKGRTDSLVAVWVRGPFSMKTQYMTDGTNPSPFAALHRNIIPVYGCIKQQLTHDALNSNMTPVKQLD